MADRLDRVKAAFGRVGEFLGKMSAGQKWAVAALGGVIVISLFWLVVGEGPSGQVPLFEESLSPEDLRKVKGALALKSIPADFRSGQVYVAEQDRERALTELAVNDALPQVTDPYAYLWDESLTFTDQQRERQEKRSLEKMLASMLATMEKVARAQVSITPPNEQLFDKAYRPAKATVLLVLRPGVKLEKENVMAIARVVASAVKNLDPRDVVITDTTGKLYASLSEDASVLADQFDAEKLRAEEYRRAVESFLYLRFTRYNVSVSVSLDMKTINEVVDKPDTENVVPAVVEKRAEERVATKSVEAPGPPLNTKEQGDRQADIVEKETLTESRTENRSGGTKTTTSKPRGDVRNLTVGVLVPLQELIKDDQMDLAQALADPQKKAELDVILGELKKLFADAVGISEAETEEKITVTAFKFLDPQPLTIGWWEGTLETLGLEEGQIGNIVMAVLALVALFGLFGFVKRSAPKPVEDVLAEVESPEAAMRGAPGAVTPEGLFLPGVVPPDVAESNWTMEQVVDFIEEEPEKAANILKRMRLVGDESDESAS